MPYWITVYCKVSPNDLQPQSLQRSVLDNDFLTLAEEYEVPLDLVKPALNSLVTTVDADEGLNGDRALR